MTTTRVPKLKWSDKGLDAYHKLGDEMEAIGRRAIRTIDDGNGNVNTSMIVIPVMGRYCRYMKYMNYITLLALYTLLMVLRIVPGSVELARLGKAMGIQTGAPITSVTSVTK